jgi:uncharacterized membrane protein
VSGAISLIKGWFGKPSHPPLTDASIGAYTAGVAMLILGALGVQEEQMAHGALLAISGGLILAAPTAITGLLDWLDLEKGTPARTMATIHLFTMVSATLLFAATWLLQRPGYNADEVRTGAWIVGLLALAVLGAGGYIGGSLVFVYGVRVVKNSETPPAEALIPGRVKPPREPAGGDAFTPPPASSREERAARSRT